jgi:hypothetical protein
MMRGAGVTKAGATCGAGEAGAGWDAGPSGALAGSGVVTELGWVTAFGLAMTSAPAGTLAAGAMGVVPRRTCPLTVLWSCCWCTTPVVNTPTMATAIARTTSRNLFERAQRHSISRSRFDLREKLAGHTRKYCQYT